MKQFSPPTTRAIALTLVMVSLLQISLLQSVQSDEQLQASIFDSIHNLIFGSSSSSSVKSVPKVTTHKAASSSSVAAVAESSSATSFAPSFTVPVQKWFTVAGYRFPRTIRTGMLGDDVLNLQLILNRYPQTQMAKTGTESPGQETGTFDYKTRIGLIGFQKANLITAEQLTRLRREQGFAGLTTRVALEKMAKDLVVQGKLPSDTTNLHAAAQSAASSLRLIQSSRSSRSTVSTASVSSETVAQTSSIASQASTASTVSTASSVTSTVTSQASSVVSTTSSHSSIASSVASQASSSKSSAASVASTAFTPNCGGGPTIHLTATCLQTINAPYLLNQTNATYILDTDVTVNETAFVIGAAGIVFDLNNHTITYGNAAPVVMTNGGFESGLTGWNTSGAPGAVIKPARIGMWGSNMLELPNFTSPQKIVSDPIQIPTANHEYIATVTGKEKTASTVMLNVIDTITGLVLASGESNASSGHAATVLFTPTSTNPIRLEIVVTPDEGTNTVDLDYAGVFYAGDYGIIASGQSTGQLSPHLKPILTAANRKAANFTVKNGAIIQGRSRSAIGMALNFMSLAGGTVDHVSTFVNGMDTLNIDAQITSNITITHSNFDADVPIISSRLRIFASIRVWSHTGPMVISDNTITNSPQAAISLNGNKSGNVTVTNNTISQRVIVSNGYGIAIRGMSDVTVAHNRIVSTAGRGIIVEGGSIPVNQNIEVYDNYVDVQEGPNLEYPANSIMNVQALRVRNYEQKIDNMNIHDNTFIVTTKPGLLQEANAARIMLENSNGQLNNTHNRFENNIFKAVTLTNDPGYSAIALGISGIEANTGVQFIGNDFQSNHKSVQVGDAASGRTTNADITFLNNKFTRLPDGGHDYSAMEGGDNHAGVTDIRFINNIYADGATEGFLFLYDVPKDVKYGKLLTINAIPGASVQITDTTGTVVFTGTTDGNGTLSNIPLIHTIYRQPGADKANVVYPKNIMTEHKAPFQVSVTGNGKTVTQSTDMTQNTTLTFNMQ